MGIYNIYAAITRIKHSKTLTEMPGGVYQQYEGQEKKLIIILVLNIIFGALIGVIGAGFDFYVRKYVLDNREIFE